ncbi:MAG TPA: hypothetical protein VGX25_04360 [Actinophytocola sp.]|uniref:hypothetical protein n=1 Tax=Actinophytocola sp. TaxID=1872138 RepID=UPI002DDCECFB|nr:hypothetical protein [Actinophytocola sp.]HEV2778613.1 hypothetical protein [Actinophytocola sp.]
MWHTVLITVHAVAGVVAFVAGCLALRRDTAFPTYLWALVTTMVFLALAIAQEWGSIDWPARALFLAFLGLGGVMLWRADRARRIRDAGSPSYVGHIGFTLVALFDAFVVVAVLNAGAPVWAVVAAGVLIAVAGHFVLGALRPLRTMPGLR